MSDPIDLNAERSRREAPDPEHVRADEYGRPLYRFLIGYEMADQPYSTHVWAYDAADAEARVTAIRQTATMDGQVFVIVTA